MNFVCLWSPVWQTGADSSVRGASRESPDAARPEIVTLAATLLTRAPRLVVGERVSGRAGKTTRVIWADARGLSAHDLARDLLELVRDDGVIEVRAGVASTPIAAELAAGEGKSGVNVVEPGRDRSFVALFPIDALTLPPRIRPLLFGIGVQTCGALARLTREAVEVRLGSEAVALWRLSRADDDRRNTLFAPIPRELPHATLDWTDYEVTDPARLLFVINALLERVCDSLAEDGRGAREMTIDFMLSDQSTHEQLLRASRATANRQSWIRLVRPALERLSLPSAVTGIAVRATRVMEREAKQSDLFDRGLASAGATEDAVARLIEDQGEIVLVPDNSGHPLLDSRTRWVVSERPTEQYQYSAPHLTLQLAPVPQSIVVETMARRDHFAPVRYRDATGWHEVVRAAGPDRVSGGKWDGAQAYAREYFRCVTREGALVWLFRDAWDHAKRNAWYLHGWWD